jgi:hypothetical protein
MRRSSATTRRTTEADIVVILVGTRVSWAEGNLVHCGPVVVMTWGGMRRASIIVQRAVALTSTAIVMIWGGMRRASIIVRRAVALVTSTAKRRGGSLVTCGLTLGAIVTI